MQTVDTNTDSKDMTGSLITGSKCSADSKYNTGSKCNKGSAGNQVVDIIQVPSKYSEGNMQILP